LSLAHARLGQRPEGAFARGVAAWLRPRNLALAACVVIAGWLVFVPLAALLYTAFTEDTGFGPGPASLKNFIEAYSSWHILRLFGNSLIFAAGTALLTLIMGGLVAWVVERTDAPCGTLFHALALLSLPREVGLHPESGKPIVAGFGRYGPYIQHDGKYASLGSTEEVFEVGLNRAVSLLAEKAASSRARHGPSVIKELGEHPELRGKVQVLTGRYGPYVKHGKVNATLPRDREPEQVTLEEAVELIAARSAKGPAKKKPAKKPARKSGKSNKETVEETAG